MYRNNSEFDKVSFFRIFRIYRVLSVVLFIRKILGYMTMQEAHVMYYIQIKIPVQEKLVTLIEHVCSKM